VVITIEGSLLEKEELKHVPDLFRLSLEYRNTVLLKGV
jgi:hypothetical protein